MTTDPALSRPENRFKTSILTALSRRSFLFIEKWETVFRFKNQNKMGKNYAFIIEIHL